MKPQLLLDTHILVWWLSEPRRLSREQTRALRESVRRHEPLAISAMTLIEIAVVFGRGSARGSLRAEDILERIEVLPMIEIVPITIAIAEEMAALGNALRDPADRAIVGTARVHRLRLVTADQRMIDSQLTTVIS